MRLARVSTPLRLAGHLPLKGGHYPIALHRLTDTVDRSRGRFCKPISPLGGEMPGRAEGGFPEDPILRW